jgi:hypothetical protein
MGLLKKLKRSEEVKEPWEIRRQKEFEQCISKAGEELNSINLNLNNLKKCKDKKERWEIAGELDGSSSMLTTYIKLPLAFGYPIRKKLYDNVVQALQRISETLGKYTELSRKSKNSRVRLFELTRLAGDCQLGLNKSYLNN